MNIKKYIADTAQEAVRLVKKEMGPEAVILRTRTLLPGKDLPQETRGKVEVTAAMDYDFSELDNPNPSFKDQPSILDKWQHLAREIAAIKEVVLSADIGNRTLPEIYYNREIRNLYSYFKSFGLRSEIIWDLMGERDVKPVKGERSKADLLQEALSRVLRKIRLVPSGNHQPGKKIYSFIGPTGVGKTTTLAKLAAIRAVKQGKKTALITLDTFRIAAVSQLQTYARIMRVPLDVAASRADLQKAILKYRDYDFILIDTVGRSPNNKKDLYELADVFKIPADIHHYLVLSATTRYRDLVQAHENFGILPIRSLIFTKLDEVQSASSMMNFLMKGNTPVSYFTTGQQVPEDIEAATKKRLAALLLTALRDKAERSRYREVTEYGSGNGSQMYGR
jgi:flagellar biosynthesis protein FlhF